MAEVAPAAPAAAGGAAPQEQPSMFGGIVRMVVMYLLFSYFFKGSPTTTTTNPVTGGPMPPHTNLWKDHQKFDLYVFVSPNAELTTADLTSQKDLAWKQSNLYYDWMPENERNTELSFDRLTSEHWTHIAENNGTLFAHAYFVRAGRSLVPDVNDNRPDLTARFHAMTPLNIYTVKKINTRKNLISGKFADDSVKSDEEALQIKQGPLTVVSSWKPTLHIRLVHDFTQFPNGGIPSPMSDFMQIEPTSQKYFPTVYFDDFWLLSEHMITINETVESLPLSVSFAPISMIKYQFKVQMVQSWKQQRDWGAADGESDELKRMLLETDPWLLGVTVVVSILHSLFDFLAFKNDIQFWKDNKSTVGISVRSIFVNCFCQVIIFFYLLDNETSWMILLSSGIGCVIEFWKLRKAAEVKLISTFPFVQIDDKQSAENEEESDTQKYDKLAMKYLSWVMYPLVIIYSIYSLYTNEHKSWYSWILSSLVGSVYAFGFIMMCPQLYVNYRLKSVAHLPWRMLTYKALNTFIDDLFAFIIKMPTMHRLSCFRDDIVFFVYLYQRWIYPVDFTRKNEFGATGEQILESQGKTIEDEQKKAEEEDGDDADEEEEVATQDQHTGEQPAVLAAPSKDAIMSPNADEVDGFVKVPEAVAADKQAAAAKPDVHGENPSPDSKDERVAAAQPSSVAAAAAAAAAEEEKERDSTLEVRKRRPMKVQE